MMSPYESARTLLSAHADKLNEGEQEAQRFLRRHAPLAPDQLALMALALRLKQLLQPIAAPEPFRTLLYDELLAHDVWRERRRWHNTRRPLYYSLAAVGSVLPLLGIVAWRRRRRSSAFALETSDPEVVGAQL